MCHFFYYFKLNLICYCSHPARMGRKSDSGLPGTPSSSQFLWTFTQSIQVEPPGLLSTWVTTLKISWTHGCSFVRPLSTLEAGDFTISWENFAMALFSPWGPAAAPEGFQGGRTSAPGNTALHPTPVPGGGIRVLFRFPSLIALPPSPSSREDNQ